VTTCAYYVVQQRAASGSLRSAPSHRHRKIISGHCIELGSAGLDLEPHIVASTERDVGWLTRFMILEIVGLIKRGGRRVYVSSNEMVWR
jgi:hypothetical protein